MLLSRVSSSKLLAHRVSTGRVCLPLLAAALLVVGDASADDRPAVASLDGVAIDAGAAVEVPAGATRQLVLADGARVTLHGGASAVLGRPQWFPPESGDKSIRGMQLYLKAGEITVRLPAVAAAKPMGLSVVTSSGQSLLAWRGVSHIVAQDGAMIVAVDEGSAYAGAQERWMRITKNTSVVMAKKEPPVSYTARLASPGWSAPAAEGLGFVAGTGRETAPLRLSWQAVPDAARYRVEVARDESMSDFIEVVEAAASERSVSAKLGAGVYYARAFALGADGVPGTGSEPRRITIARVALPAGASIASDGVFVLPPKGEIALDPPGVYALASAAGSDMDGALRGALASTFTEPTRVTTLPLGSQNARAIRVRDASGAGGMILLARRELRARVTMTPVRARWPENPITATVRLEDVTRRLDTTSEPVTLEVRINAELVPAAWKREGDTLRARLEPREGPGPWLISVVARDDASKAEIGSHIIDLDGLQQFELKLPENERKPAAAAAR